MGGLGLGCSLLTLLLAGTGAGARHVETTIQDDAVMLHRTDAAVQQAASQMASLGVDRLRITAGWSALAPAPRARRRPRGGFRPSDPATYPADGFARLDRAVKAADRAGLRVQIDVAFWAPRWAVRRPGSQPDRQRDMPRPRAFGRFAEAVARRYSGRFPDPGGRGALPAVRLYTTWNEPNHTSFLAPQWKRHGDGWRPYSPHLYRAMHERAYDAIKRVSPDNRVLVGGTSSFGSRRPGSGHVPPLEFLRTLACVDERLQPLRVPECAGAPAVRADGYAHHAYSLDTLPGESAPDPDDVPIADLDRLSLVLDGLHAAGRIDRRWRIYITEYGYETGPPDPYVDVTPAEQAAYLSWASHLAHQRPDVAMFAQFLLRDIDARESGHPPWSRRHWRDWQTGLLYADGRPKPAAQAFKLPLHAQRVVGVDGAPALLLFGGVRPGTGHRTVRVERRDPVTGRWSPVRAQGVECDTATGEFHTEEDGFFRRLAPWEGPAAYRLAWRRGDRFEHGPPVRAWPEPALVAAG